MPNTASAQAWLGLAVTLCTFSCDGLRFGPPPMGGLGDDGGQAALSNAAVAVPRCRGAGGNEELSGAFVFLLESVSEVGGSLPGTQSETVSRIGILSLCQEGADVVGVGRVCNLAMTRLRDESGDCAALQPSIAVLATLPGFEVRGQVIVDDDGTSAVELAGFVELWGLSGGNALPAETVTADPDEAAPPGVFDQDLDDAPGVTLTGNGEVPTHVWAVRATALSARLGVDDPRAFEGRTASQTEERIIGGPAARAVVGRTRQGRPGRAAVHRADARFGSRAADANGDGIITCGEATVALGGLPPPSRDVCEGG